jgi:Tol biopolymer transport system component
VVAQIESKAAQALRTTTYLDPSFSRDGKQIVYQKASNEKGADPDEQLIIVDIDGSHARALKTPGLSAEHPRFSPDGSRIVFCGRASGPSDIWVIGSDGTGLTQLTSKSGYNSKPVFDSSGNVVYVREIPENKNVLVWYDLKTKSEEIIVGECARVIWAIPVADGFIVKYLSKFGEPWIIGRVKKGKTVPEAIKGLPATNPQEIEIYRSTLDGHRALLGIRDSSGDGTPKLWLKDNGKWVEVPALRTRDIDLSPDGTMFAFVARPSENAKKGIYLYSIDQKLGKPVVADQ